MNGIQEQLNYLLEEKKRPLVWVHFPPKDVAQTHLLWLSSTIGGMVILMDDLVLLKQLLGNIWGPQGTKRCQRDQASIDTAVMRIRSWKDPGCWTPTWWRRPLSDRAIAHVGWPKPLLGRLDRSRFSPNVSQNQPFSAPTDLVPPFSMLRKPPPRNPSNEWLVQ